MIKVGKGWRAGYGKHASPYVALVGGDDWAFELNQREWENLGHLLSSLLDTIGEISAELSDQETFRLTIDSEWWELEVEGIPEHWQLRMQTRSERRAEGFLPWFAVIELATHLREQLQPDRVPKP
ncbi:MAG: DUF1818 family protein [Cyanobacteria bacterium KgW148]|nr:DUF1818 family protein [Cyanobacteria bacterium KgW148]